MIGSYPTKKHPEDDLCKLHHKICKLFCLNCAEGICSACMDIGEHDLHQVSNLAVVYSEKLSVVKSKLVQAEKYHNGLRSGTASAYERNLRLLEKEEAFHRKEIEAIAKEADLQVSQMTRIRKAKLKQQLELTMECDQILVDMQSKVEQLSANEFLQQSKGIAQKCDKLIATPYDVSLESVDDIECQLIPPYKFQQFVYPAFLKTKTNAIYDFVMKSAHGVEWKLTITKSAVVQIKPIPTDSQILQYRHILVVVMPHRDYTKEIRHTFVLDGKAATFDLVKTVHIADEGFCNYLGDLVMKIGIRPHNLLIEKQLLVHQYTQKKDACTSLQKRLQSITDEYDYKHLVMNFNPKLTNLQKGVFLYSYRIRDDEARQWCLSVKLKSNGVVGAYIELLKGSPVNCSYFIELKHRNPLKQVLNTTKCRYYNMNGRKSAAWGWEMIAWEDLSKDAGFHPAGMLHFRFGVRPLPVINVVA